MMLPYDVIAFDADDTLWHNEPLYSRAKADFARLLAGYQPYELVAQRLDEIESGNVSVYGYGIKSFALSLVETAAAVSGGRISGREIQDVLALVHAMLEAEIDMVAGVPETLQQLSGRYVLMLITKGDLFEQARKIDRSGLAGHFRFIEVVADKTPQAYQALLDRYHIPAGRFLMVGNSLRSDILPVLAIGGRAVYIPYESTWTHEHVAEEALAGVSFDRLEHIRLLPDYLNASSS